jgi:hypothetical protein
MDVLFPSPFSMDSCASVYVCYYFIVYYAHINSSSKTKCLLPSFFCQLMDIFLSFCCESLKQMGYLEVE